MGKSNVNPDHYKTAGRERQGEDIVQQEYKSEMSQTRTELARRARQRSDSRERMLGQTAHQAGLFDPDQDKAAGTGSAKKKSAARKSAAKKRSSKSAAKKSPAKKGAAKKSPAKKGAAKKRSSSKTAAKNQSPKKRSPKKSARPARKK